MEMFKPPEMGEMWKNCEKKGYQQGYTEGLLDAIEIASEYQNPSAIRIALRGHLKKLPLAEVPSE